MTKIKLVVFAIILFIFISLISAEEKTRRIAINPETKECAGFWEGNEESYYTLPQGWISYNSVGLANGTCFRGGGDCTNKLQCKVNNYVDGSCLNNIDVCMQYCNFFNIYETHLGTCYSKNFQEKECCKYLGLEYISLNIGKRVIKNEGILKAILELGTIGIVSFILLLILIIIIIIRVFLPGKRRIAENLISRY